MRIKPIVTAVVAGRLPRLLRGVRPITVIIPPLASILMSPRRPVMSAPVVLTSVPVPPIRRLLLAPVVTPIVIMSAPIPLVTLLVPVSLAGRTTRRFSRLLLTRILLPVGSDDGRLGVAPLIVHQRFTGDRLVGVWRFGLGFFYIDFALVYLGYGDLFDQLLGHAFVFEGDEAKSATFACIDVFENDGILDLTKILLKVIFQLLTSQIEIQPAHKYLTFWVRIRNHVLVLGGFAVDLDVGVGFVEVVEVGREGGVGGEVG